MRYYLQLRDWQIAALSGKPRITVNYQKNADLKERSNAKLLIAVMKFRMDYQPPGKRQSHEKPVF